MQGKLQAPPGPARRGYLGAGMTLLWARFPERRIVRRSFPAASCRLAIYGGPAPSPGSEVHCRPQPCLPRPCLGVWLRPRGDASRKASAPRRPPHPQWEAAITRRGQPAIGSEQAQRVGQRLSPQRSVWGLLRGGGSGAERRGWNLLSRPRGATRGQGTISQEEVEDEVTLAGQEGSQ